MPNRILKSLALAAGAGAALGFSAGLGRQRKNASTIETTRLPASDLEVRIERQSKEIATLRAQVNESVRRASTEFAAFEERLAAARTELPAAVEAAITPRMDELRARLDSEMREATATGLARIDQGIDEKLESRVEAIEKTLADQSADIVSLNRRAIETDTNLQKLISSMERLCDRSGARLALEPVEEPSFLDLPFQAQYKAALEHEPATATRVLASIK